MDKDLEQSLRAEDKQTEGSALPEAAVSGASRRRFTRNAVVGGAVVLSLGNRAAWGTTGDVTGDNCVSLNTLTSYSTASLGPADEGLSTIQKVDAYDLYDNDENERVIYANSNGDESNPIHCWEPKASCTPYDSVPPGQRRLVDGVLVDIGTGDVLCDPPT